MKHTLLYKLSFIALFSFTFMQGAAQHTVISLPQMNMVYCGIRNKIDVGVEGYTQKQIVLKATGAKIIKDHGQYYLIPFRDAREVILKVGVSKEKGVKWVRTETLRARRLTIPEAIFGSKTGGYISLGELETIAFVNAGLGDGFAYEGIRYNIIWYTLLAFYSGGKYEQRVEGNRIPAEARVMFQSKFHGGEDIYVYGITAVCMNTGDTVVCDPISLTVKSNENTALPPQYRLDAYVNLDGKKIEFSMGATAMDRNLMNLLLGGSRNGVWKLYRLDRCMDTLISEHYYDKDTLQWVKQYAKGKLKVEIHTPIKGQQGSYTDYYDNGNTRRKGALCDWKYFQYEGDDSFSNNAWRNQLMHKDTVYDVEDLRNQPICGYWYVYYPDGSLYAEGALDTSASPRYYTEMDVYPEVYYPPVHIVKNGLWKYYSRDGKVEKVTYNKGRLMKREY